eukprot:SAG31_NODE_4536_length_3157_cov_5.125899_3_plen_62_part_00
MLANVHTQTLMVVILTPIIRKMKAERIREGEVLVSSVDPTHQKWTKMLTMEEKIAAYHVSN